MSPQFAEALARFLEGAQQIVTENEEKQARACGLKAPGLRMKLETMDGVKRVRIVATDGHHRSAWAFIDKATGDVLKPESWARPAKHARGNIYAADHGLGTIGPHGPAYLR